MSEGVSARAIGPVAKQHANEIQNGTRHPSLGKDTLRTARPTVSDTSNAANVATLIPSSTYDVAILWVGCQIAQPVHRPTKVPTPDETMKRGQCPHDNMVEKAVNSATITNGRPPVR